MRKCVFFIICLSFFATGCSSNNLECPDPNETLERKVTDLIDELNYEKAVISRYETLTGTFISINKQQDCNKDILLYIKSKVDMNELDYEYDTDNNYYVVYEYKNIYPFILKLSKDISSDLKTDNYYMFTIGSMDDYSFDDYSNEMLFKKTSVTNIRNATSSELDTYHAQAQAFICEKTR